MSQEEHEEEQAQDPAPEESPQAEPVEVEAEPISEEERAREEGRTVDAGDAGASAPGRGKAWAVACHLSTLVTFATPLGNVGGILAPLLIWQLVDREDPELGYHAKEALNFQVNVFFWMLVSTILSACCIGIPMLIATVAANVVLTIIASLKAGDGERYRYPWILRLLD